MKFRIPLDNIEWLQERIGKLAKKASKLGCPPISLTLSENLVEEHEDGSVSIYRLVEVVGEAPVLNGWAFVARLHYLGADEGNLVLVVPNQILPEEFRVRPPQCDYCETTRMRKDTFVVQDTSNGIYFQVGSDCLRDFLGHPHPEQVAQYAEWLSTAAELVRAAETQIGPAYQERFSLELFLALTSATIRKDGWVSRKKAREAYENGAKGLSATADMVWHMLAEDKIREYIPSPQDHELAVMVEVWAGDLPEPVEDYLWNLRAIAQAGWVDRRMAGFAASMVSAYQRAHQALTPQGEWIGEIGGRLTLALLLKQFKVTEPIDPSQPRWYIYKFADDVGNAVTWITSCNRRLEEGRVYQVKATVKKHSEFRGVRETCINRPVFLGVNLANG